MSAVKQDTDNGVRHAIEVRGLDNRFGTQQVHQDLDLDVRRGEILGVVGGAGTGKSVLLRSVVGLQKPHSGVVRIGGRDLLRAQWLARARMERRFGILVGLPAGAGDKYPASLSGGMVKRAALARALALDANILFLDEPTAGLDPIGAASFDQLILTLRNALGLTVFLVTHDLDTLYTICDRVAVLANQKVLINDGIEAVERFKHPWIQEHFHGPRGRAAAQATGASSQETQP